MSLIAALKDFFLTWLSYFMFTSKGVYYWCMFRFLQVWYIVFTPKNAEYIEDIPRLDWYNRKLSVWKLEAIARVATSTLWRK